MAGTTFVPLPKHSNSGALCHADCNTKYKHVQDLSECDIYISSVVNIICNYFSSTQYFLCFVKVLKTINYKINLYLEHTD